METTTNTTNPFTFSNGWEMTPAPEFWHGSVRFERSVPGAWMTVSENEDGTWSGTVDGGAAQTWMTGEHATPMAAMEAAERHMARRAA